MTSFFARRTNWNLASNAYTCALEEHRRAGRELLDLTASNPTTIGLQYDEEKILQALARPESRTYEPTAQGLLSAREAVASYYADRGMVVSPDDLILTTSTSEAYTFVFRLLCNPGDAVLVPTPSYPLFDFLAVLQDIELVPYELVYDHGWQMDFHPLEQAASRRSSNPALAQYRGKPNGTARDWPQFKAVIVVHPNNPTGSFVKREEARRLGRLCGQNGWAIVSDEVFLDYHFMPESPISFAATQDLEPPLTFTLSGLSKISGLPQMKFAWVAVNGPKELKRDALNRLEVIADTYLSMNAPVQLAVPALLNQRHSIQRQIAERLRSNLNELDLRLASQALCERLQLQGGWYAVLRVPATGPDEELAIALLQETGVLVQPGHFYDFAGDGYLVISLITPPEIFAAGVKRLLKFIDLRYTSRPPTAPFENGAGRHSP